VPSQAPLWRQLLTAAVSTQTGKHDVADCNFEHTLGFGQSVVQTGTFFQFGFIECRVADNDTCGLAAGSAQRIEFVGNPGGAANRQGSVIFD
jgi:hypothetical protein